MNFRSSPWKDVLDWYSTIADLPLHADEVPNGAFNYADDELHSLEQITNILRVVLRTKGFLLKRQPEGIQLIRLQAGGTGNLLGLKLPTQDELDKQRKSLAEMQNRIAELNEQRDTLPGDANNRDTQLAVIKTQTDAQRAEYETALAVLEAEATQVQVVLDDAKEMSEHIATINAKSADCVPLHTIMALTRERLAAQATLDEIQAILDVGRNTARAPTNK
jgi:hypothetical protein